MVGAAWSRAVGVVSLCFAAWLLLFMAEAQAELVNLFEIRVDGNTVLSSREIEAVVYPFLGPAQSLERLEAARAALEARYRELGYATVGVAIPEQTVRHGVAKLDVVEQQIGRLRVSGARYFSHRDIRRGVPSLTEGRVMNTRDVQQDLNALARRSPDRRIDPLIRAGNSPGKLDVELRVEDRLPLHASLELNNYASPNTEDLRLVGSLSYSNLFQRQNTLSLGYQVTPQDRDNVEVLSATYVHRPRGSNAIYALTAVTSDSDVAAVGDTSVVGRGEFVSARVTLPLQLRPDTTDLLVFGVDYKDSEDLTTFQSAFLDDQTREATNQERITYLNWSAGYVFSRPLWGVPTRYSATANFGIRGLLNEREEFERKRYKAEPNYLHLDLSLNRRQPLPVKGLSLLASLNAQLASDPLVGNEQFSLGGVNSVRGYLESEELADHGFVAQLALAYEGVPAAQTLGLQVLPYMFWDWGSGGVFEPLPGEPGSIRLSSAGVGLSVARRGGFNADALWAYVLEDGASTERGDNSVSFRVKYEL